MKCKLCKKEVDELIILFDKMVCRKCIKNYEEGCDSIELVDIVKRRGTEWVKKQINIK